MTGGAGIARLTPAFSSGVCHGYIHSVFESAANAAFFLGGEQRLLTLAARGMPKTPDSLSVPEPWLRLLAEGQEACLEVRETNGAFRADGQPLAFTRDMGWDGHIPAYGGLPAASAFHGAADGLEDGFCHMPPRAREAALAALTTPQAPQWLGLGPGLTPSFDDACVGLLAVCRAAGKPAPFQFTDFSATTDVSARYLRLAQEGYFCEPLCELAEALFSPGKSAGVRQRVIRMAAYGATSGKDVLRGVGAGLNLLLST